MFRSTPPCEGRLAGLTRVRPDRLFVSIHAPVREATADLAIASRARKSNACFDPRPRVRGDDPRRRCRRSLGYPESFDPRPRVRGDACAEA